MKRLALVALLVGCYTTPRPLTAQQKYDQDLRAYYDQQALVQARAQQAEQAEEDRQNAQTERACAATTDINVQLTCAEWRITARRLKDERRWRQEDRQRAEDNRAYQQAQTAQEAQGERRRRIADAIEAAGKAYQAPYLNQLQSPSPTHCTGMVSGN